MKKILSIIICLAMVFSFVGLTACSKAEPLKFGVGIHSYYAKASNADGETNGEGEAVETIAAVLLDKDGKIVKCAIDTADSKVQYTSKGKVIAVEEFKTKYELGKDYNMAAYGQDLNGDGKVMEWFEQIDVLTATAVGKTIDEVKALVLETGYGAEDLANAGCTINVSDYIKALEKACANAKESEATAEDTLKLGVVTSQSSSNKDASDDADGVNEVVSSFTAAALNKDGKVVIAQSECIVAKFTFDKKGVAKTDVKAELKGKVELGKDYNMAAYGQDLNGDGKVLEYNEQSAAFDAACVGKTADEIAAFAAENGYGVESIQTAGCTMNIGDIVKAAVKAATVA